MTTSIKKSELHIVNKRNGRIEFLRFLFAFIVMLHHSRYLLGDDNCYFLGGSLGVEYFFLVSGYLMMASLERLAQKEQKLALETGAEILVKKNGALAGETVSFLKRKVKGVLPQFPIAWLLGFIFIIIVNRQTAFMAGQEFIGSFGELTFLRMSGISNVSLDGVMWYVSSMLLCMAILYPLLRLYPEMMKKLWCPLITIVLLGITCGIDGHPRNPTKWYQFIYKGNIRAMAELCLGIWAYPLTQKIKEIKWTTFARVVFEIAQLAGYVAIVAYMYYYGPCADDYFFIMIMTVCVMLSFAGVGIASDLFNNPVSYWVGKFSTALYFSHIYYAHNLNQILPQTMSKQEKMLIYILCAVATALVVEGLSAVWKKVGPCFQKGIHAAFIKAEA